MPLMPTQRDIPASSFTVEKTAEIIGTATGSRTGLNGWEINLTKNLYDVFDEIEIQCKGSDHRQSAVVVLPLGRNYPTAASSSGFSLNAGHFNSSFEYWVEGYFTGAGQKIAINTGGTYTGNLTINVIGINYTVTNAS